ncbi:MAG: hypothetical protein ACD_78C00078G0001, partial [uncultured bacterium (gcode 4)]
WCDHTNIYHDEFFLFSCLSFTSLFFYQTMKRFVVFLLILLSFGGIYNFSTLWDSLSGFFGDISYQKDHLPDAKKHYEDILKDLSGSTLLKADTLYNLGNTLYKLGQWEKDIERLRLWGESVGNYTKSLSIRTDRETEENLAFVREQIQQEEKEQKQKKEEEKKEQEEKTGSGTETKPEQKENTENKEPREGRQTESGDGKKETTEQSGNEKDTLQPKQNWSNGGSYNPIGWQNKDALNSQLSDIDRQEVKKYLETLKQFEKQNGKLLNPEKWGEAGSLSNQIRNFFGYDSFFQDVLPSNDGKKDW